VADQQQTFWHSSPRGTQVVGRPLRIIFRKGAAVFPRASYRRYKQASRSCALNSHGDHVGGCFPIVNALRVDAIGDSGQEYGGRAFRDCLAAAQVRHVPVILVRKGMHYATGDGA